MTTTTLIAKEIFAKTIEHGGSTTPLYHGESTSRFIAARNGFGKTVPLKEFSESVISEYISTMKACAKFVGTWLDTETNLVWLDDVVSYDQEESARAYCVANNEIAYFDTYLGLEVRM